MTTICLEDIHVFEAVWMEMLGDLARYLYGIEFEDEGDKEHWKEVARDWYLKAVNLHNALEGRLYHHLGILSKDDPLLQLYYFSKR